MYIVDIQYHIWFFTRYFVLEYVFESYSLPAASVLCVIGYYLLARNVILFGLSCRVNPGAVSELKYSKTNYERKRQVEVINMVGQLT